jgi:hypothetical protein
MQAAIRVIEQVQMLDQQVTAMAFGRAQAYQRPHLGKGTVVGLTPLEFAFAVDAVAQLVDRGEDDGGNVWTLAGWIHAAL